MGWLQDLRAGKAELDRKIEEGIMYYGGPDVHRVISQAGGLLDFLSPVGDYAGAAEGSRQAMQGITSGQPKQAATGIMDMASNLASTMMPGNANDIAQIAMFGGPMARTANPAKLTQAQQMDSVKAPPPGIWSNTGWMKGPEGAWKFEISDANRKSDIPGAIAARKTEYARLDAIAKDSAMLRKLLDSGTKLEDAKYAIKQLYGREPNPRSIDIATDPKVHTSQVIAQANRMAALAADPTLEPFRLDELLDHDELYQAYPDAKSIPVRIVNDPFAGYKAAFHPDTGGISFQKAYSKDPDYTLGHEIQHWIQRKEGWATGGNSTTTVQDRLVPLEKQIGNLLQAGANDNFNNWLQKRQAAGRIMPTDPIKYYMKVRPRDTKFKELVKLNEEREQLVEQGYSDYKYLAGEAEARNTQIRRNMTDAERRAHYPPITMDVPLTDLIVKLPKP